MAGFVSRKLKAVFGLVLALVLVNSLIAARAVQALDDHDRWVAHTQQALAAVRARLPRSTKPKPGSAATCSRATTAPSHHIQRQ